MKRSQRKFTKSARAATAISMNTGEQVGLYQRGYAAAAGNRFTSDWKSGGSSQDAELAGDLTTLRNRSRQMLRDNPHAMNLCRIVQNNVVGSGISTQARVVLANGDPDDDLNNEIEAAWAEWCEKESCHTAGQLSMTDMLRLAMAGVFRDGEFFIRKVHRSFGNGDIPFALEVIEPDLLLDFEGAPVRSSNGIDFRLGIEVDDWMRPVAYWFRDKHPGDLIFPQAEEKARRIPAREIEHLYVVNRWPQTRGTPWMHPILMRMRQMSGYAESELIAARIAANNVGFIEQNIDTEPTPGGGTKVAPPPMERSEPGTFRRLCPGEKVTPTNLNRPAGNLEVFMRYMLREIAAGVGVSYESLSRDYSQSNYSSSRLALLEERDQWRVLQRWLIHNFLSHIYREWLDAAVLSGRIRIRDYFENKRKYQAVEFKPRGWSWVDPTKEMKAYETAVRLGIMSRTDAAAASGSNRDYQEILNEIKTETDMIKEAGLDWLTKASPQTKDNLTEEGEESETKD